MRRGLIRSHYTVDVASTGAEGLEMAISMDHSYSLILLDVMLPDMDGCDLSERLRRARIAVPILMLTARDAVSDRVRGLEAGADDYLVKPFDFAELLARVRALLRRDKVHRIRVVEVADLRIDTAARNVSRAGRQLSLTPREYALLETLALAEGRVLTREILQDTVWAGEEVYPNTVDVCVGHLRRKMDSSHPVKLLKTIHGVGYSIQISTDTL